MMAQIRTESNRDCGMCAEFNRQQPIQSFLSASKHVSLQQIMGLVEAHYLNQGLIEAQNLFRFRIEAHKLSHPPKARIWP